MELQTSPPNNTRVAKNAIALTVRMIVVMFVGLYTSRVVFSQLGDIDYGIYGVVGGILGFMSFLTTSMSGATSRFITYAIGVGNEGKINEIFNSSFLIHCAIALIVIIVGETFGIWFLNNVLVIPEERLDAAWWVFQFSVISSAISVTQVPYTAVLMAYEKMNIYAYFEIINISLKLLIVFLLSISQFDKLVTYSFLLLVVSAIMALSYRLYCIRNFNVSKLRRIRDYSVVKSMLSFSGMDLYGNISVTLNNQGLTYAINIFFGVIYNTAVSLATTINGMLLSLTTNIAIAFKPQIIKQYAQGNIAAMEEVMRNSIKFTLVAMALLAVPCALEADFVLNIWLGEVPAYSVEFLRIIIVQSFFPIINNVCNATIHANGNIKSLTFINGSIFLIMPVIIFVIYHFGANVLWGYGIEILGMILIVAIAISIVKRLIPEFACVEFLKTIFMCAAVILICIIPVVIINQVLNPGFLRVFVETLAYAFLISSMTWLLILTKPNRELVKARIKAMVGRI